MLLLFVLPVISFNLASGYSYPYNHNYTFSNVSCPDNKLAVLDSYGKRLSLFYDYHRYLMDQDSWVSIDDPVPDEPMFIDATLKLHKFEGTDSSMFAVFKYKAAQWLWRNGNPVSTQLFCHDQCGGYWEKKQKNAMLPQEEAKSTMFNGELCAAWRFRPLRSVADAIKEIHKVRFSLGQDNRDLSPYVSEYMIRGIVPVRCDIPLKYICEA